MKDLVSGSVVANIFTVVRTIGIVTIRKDDVGVTAVAASHVEPSNIVFADLFLQFLIIGGIDPR